MKNTLFTLNCPQCRGRLRQVPLDGLTLHYQCAEHGSLYLRPLELVEQDDSESHEDVHGLHRNAAWRSTHGSL